MSSSKDTPAAKVSGDAAEDPEIGASPDLVNGSWVPAFPEQVFADETVSNRKRFTKLVAKSSPKLVKAAKRLAGLAQKD